MCKLIQELFLNVGSILRNPKTVDLQYTTKESEQYCCSLLTPSNKFLYKTHHQNFRVIDYKIRFIPKLA